LRGGRATAHHFNIKERGNDSREKKRKVESGNQSRRFHSRLQSIRGGKKCDQDFWGKKKKLKTMADHGKERSEILAVQGTLGQGGMFFDPKRSWLSNFWKKKKNDVCKGCPSKKDQIALKKWKTRYLNLKERWVHAPRENS